MNNSRLGLPTGGIFTTAIALSLATSGIVHAQTAKTAVATDTAWINRPAQDTTQETDTTAA